jgi:hypothetical protein
MSFASDLRDRVVYALRTFRGLYRRAMWDVLTPASFQRELQTYRVHERVGSPFAGATAGIEDPRVRTGFLEYESRTDREYIYRLTRPSIIERRYGYVIAAPRYLIEDSTSYGYFVRHPKYRPYFRGVPSLRHYARIKLLPGARVRRVPRAVLLRDTFDANYWHFFNDVLGKIGLLERHGMPLDGPFVIGAELYRQRFFAEAWQRTPMRSAELIVQSDFDIACDEVVFAKALDNARVNFDAALRLLEAPPADRRAKRRLFLTRAGSVGRSLENIDAISSVCDLFGFEIVDTSGMAFDAQMELFASARFLAGIHGAGLVNMIFRRNAALALLEIFPPDSIPAYFCALARDYGFRYDAIVGEAVGRHESAGTGRGTFALDPRKFAERLRLLVKSEGTE